MNYKECQKKCYWNFDGLCCTDGEEALNEANPTENEKCPSWLRKDFEQHLNNTYHEVCELANNRNLKQLEEIKDFILKQECEE